MSGGADARRDVKLESHRIKGIVCGQEMEQLRTRKDGDKTFSILYASGMESDPQCKGAQASSQQAKQHRILNAIWDPAEDSTGFRASGRAPNRTYEE